MTQSRHPMEREKDNWTTVAQVCIEPQTLLVIGATLVADCLVCDVQLNLSFVPKSTSAIRFVNKLIKALLRGKALSALQRACPWRFVAGGLSRPPAFSASVVS